MGLILSALKEDQKEEVMKTMKTLAEQKELDEMDFSLPQEEVDRFIKEYGGFIPFYRNAPQEREKYRLEVFNDAFKQGEKRGEKKGEKRGEVIGFRKSILNIGKIHFSKEAPQKIKEQLDKVTDLKRLNRMQTALFEKSVQSWDELLTIA